MKLLEELGDDYLEEIAARFITSNIQGRPLDMCSIDIQNIVIPMSEKNYDVIPVTNLTVYVQGIFKNEPNRGKI